MQIQSARKSSDGELNLVIQADSDMERIAILDRFQRYKRNEKRTDPDDGDEYYCERLYKTIAPADVFLTADGELMVSIDMAAAALTDTWVED